MTTNAKRLLMIELLIVVAIIGIIAAIASPTCLLRSALLNEDQPRFHPHSDSRKPLCYTVGKVPMADLVPFRAGTDRQRPRRRSKERLQFALPPAFRYGESLRHGAAPQSITSPLQTGTRSSRLMPPAYLCCDCQCHQAPQPRQGLRSATG